MPVAVCLNGIVLEWKAGAELGVNRSDHDRSAILFSAHFLTILIDIAERMEIVQNRIMRAIPPPRKGAWHGPLAPPPFEQRDSQP